MKYTSLKNLYIHSTDIAIALSSIAGIAATLLSTVPPLWIGGVPEYFVAPYVGPESSFESFQGCISQFTFTNIQNTPPSLISFAPAAYNQ